MLLTVKELRFLIREACGDAHELNELFGKKQGFAPVLDDIMQSLLDTNKKIEKAHELAPSGAAKAIVAGLHSDLFNKVAEFRDYIKQLKAM